MSMCKNSCCCKIGRVLVMIGAVSWGLIGLFNYNFVEAFFGSWPVVVRIVYIVIGLAGVMCLVKLCKGSCCKSGTCTTETSGASPSGGGVSDA